MHIHTLKISHFRNLADLTVSPNENINIIVGPNNSGKTNILRATSLLLDPTIPWHRDETITIFDYTNAETTTPITIDAWLQPSHTDTEDTRARLYNKLSHWNTDNPTPQAITRDPTTDDETPATELLHINLTATWNEERQAADVTHTIKDETGQDTGPFTLDHKRLIDFRYFPARRDPLQQLSLARRSLLARNIKEEDLARILRQLRGALERTKEILIEEQAVKKFLKDMITLVAPELLNTTGFTLTFLNSEIGRLRSTTNIATEQTNHLLPLDHQGDGVQNLLLILNIIRLATGNSTIIALEEPEQNLEPAIARWTFSQIADLSQERANQTFITTHSPALLQELNGTDPILLASPTKVTAAKHLKPDTKKRFERYATTYASALFARHILITEGPSEIGFLPVALRHYSTTPAQNPFHFGLELLNGEDRTTALRHARTLHELGRPTTVLIDFDQVRHGETSTDDLLREATTNGIHATTWSRNDLLPYARGCDLEILLAATTPPALLRQAILAAYEQPGHELTADEWQKAKAQITDASLRDQLPNECDLQALNTTSGPEDVERATNLALMHGPHSCKSAREMRLIAQALAKHNAVPKVFDALRSHLLQITRQPDEPRSHVLLG